MCITRVMERRLIAVNVGIIAAMIVGVLFAAWQGYVGNFDGRGLVALVALIVVGILAVQRERIEHALRLAAILEPRR